MAIFATSDMHFGHDREFVWKVRGFNSIQEMNDAYVNRWNSVVGPEDDVYCLGDLMLGDPSNIEYIKKLNGKIHIVYGNHDTNNRRKMYASYRYPTFNEKYHYNRILEVDENGNINEWSDK